MTSVEHWYLFAYYVNVNMTSVTKYTE